jgi:hypothetical protein
MLKKLCGATSPWALPEQNSPYSVGSIPIGSTVRHLVCEGLRFYKFSLLEIIEFGRYCNYFLSCGWLVHGEVELKQTLPIPFSILRLRGFL